mgnify:CR=1 FL=1
MDRAEVATKIGDIAGVLRSAQEFKGPYVLEINGVKAIVSRENFLEFYMDVAIQDLWDLGEVVETSGTQLRVVKKR